MKRIITALFLIVCIGTIHAADLASDDFISLLLSLSGPVSPVVYQDSVIFTASSSYRRVGISFAYEGFSKVYWLQKLLVPRDPAEVAADTRKNADPNRDSGILFHVQVIPDGIKNLEYRMIIDGLWTSDPNNPQVVAGSGGINNSRVSLPVSSVAASTTGNASGALRFSFTAAPGDTVTVAGSFNNWDPFMYEMKETARGSYSLTLSLPPGTYQYVFFYHGERLLDPNNPEKVYTRDGKAVSMVTIK
ncbi:MAG: isoamylase [Treponema sp.]|nr:isoamylase [Treponema sp.]